MSGAPLPRGTVTFLFSDVEGSTDLLRRVGDEVFSVIRDDHRRLLRDAFAKRGGREVDTAGDGFFVAFESARSAVAAAVSAQIALAASTWPADAAVRVRMGLHTAEPHLGGEGYVGIGVHRAARICDAARGGQILVSNATAGIIEDAELPGVELLDLGEHRLKGLPREQRLFQLSVLTLPSEFGPPRTAEASAQTPGAGTFVHTDLTGVRHMIHLLGDEASEALLADYQATVASVWSTRTTASSSSEAVTMCSRFFATRARRCERQRPSVKHCAISPGRPGAMLQSRLSSTQAAGPGIPDDPLPVQLSPGSYASPRWPSPGKCSSLRRRLSYSRATAAHRRSGA